MIVFVWMCWWSTLAHILCKALWLLLSRAYYFSKINQPPNAYNRSNESSHDKLKNLSYPDRTHTSTSHTTTTHFSGWAQMAHIYNHDKKTPAIKCRLQTGTLVQRKASFSRERRECLERIFIIHPSLYIMARFSEQRKSGWYLMKNTTGSAQRVIGGTLGLIKCNKWNELINLQVLQYIMWYKKGKSINHCQTEGTTTLF